MRTLNASEFTLRSNNASRREVVASLVAPAGQALVIGGDGLPYVFKPAIHKKLVTQTLGATVTISLSEPYPLLGYTPWQTSGEDAVVFIYADGGSASSANKVTINTRNHIPTNTIVAAVPGGNQTASQTVEVWHVGGRGVFELVRLRRADSSLTKEDKIYGPRSVIEILSNNPFNIYSLAMLPQYAINELETLEIIYASGGATDILDWTSVSGVNMPWKIFIPYDVAMVVPHAQPNTAAVA